MRKKQKPREGRGKIKREEKAADSGSGKQKCAAKGGNKVSCMHGWRVKAMKVVSWTTTRMRCAATPVTLSCILNAPNQLVRTTASFG